MDHWPCNTLIKIEIYNAKSIDYKKGSMIGETSTIHPEVGRSRCRAHCWGVEGVGVVPPLVPLHLLDPSCHKGESRRNPPLFIGRMAPGGLRG